MPAAAVAAKDRRMLQQQAGWSRPPSGHRRPAAWLVCVVSSVRSWSGLRLSRVLTAVAAAAAVVVGGLLLRGVFTAVAAAAAAAVAGVEGGGGSNG